MNAPTFAPSLVERSQDSLNQMTFGDQSLGIKEISGLTEFMQGDRRMRTDDGSGNNFVALGLSKVSADEIVLGYSKTSSSFVSKEDPKSVKLNPGKAQ